MKPFVAEAIGTALLIIFGDGVVAGVLLNKSKAQNSGWMVITTGWAMGVAIAVYAVGRISGAHLNPAITLGLAVIGKFAWSDVPLVHRGSICWGLPWRRGRMARLPGALAGDRGSGRETLGLLDDARHSPHAPEPHHRNHWNVCAGLWGARDSGKRRSNAIRSGACSRGFAGLGHWPLPGSSHRIRHQPRPRPGSAPRSRAAAHCGKGQLRLGVFLGARCGAADRWRNGRGGVRRMLRGLVPSLRVASHRVFVHRRPRRGSLRPKGKAIYVKASQSSIPRQVR